MRIVAALACGSAFATALLLACSGDDSPAATPDAGGSTAGDGAITPLDAGDGAPADNRILPLALGRTWSFDAHVVDGGVPEASAGAVPCIGPQTTQVIGPGGTYDGGASLRYRPLCSGVNAVDIVGTEDRLVAYPLSPANTPTGTAVLFLDSPVEEGHQWTYGGTVKFEWRNAGPQVVPAGTFTDCWERHPLDAAGQGSVIYCRGVGQVRFNNNDGTEAVLTAKNF